MALDIGAIQSGGRDVGAVQSAAGITPVTLAYAPAAAAASAAYAAGNTPPAVTTTYGAASGSATAAYAAAAVVGTALTYAPSAGSATAAYAATNTPPAATLAYAATAAPATAAYAAAAGVATYTTVQAGNWTDTATWNSATVPGATNSATVNHAVTVDGNVSVGGLAINAALTVAAGKTFTVKGAVVQAGAAFTMAAGSSLVLDTTGGAFTWQVGTAANQYACHFVVNGSSGSRCSISVTGGNSFYFTDPNESQTAWDVNYCDFGGLSSNNADPLQSVAVTLANYGDTNSVAFRHCNFDACGSLYSAVGFTAAATTTWEVTDCRWTNTPAGVYPLNVRVGNASPGTYLVTFSRNSVDATAALNAGGLVVEDNYFDHRPEWPGGSPYLWQWNFVRLGPEGQTLTLFCSQSNTYILGDEDRGNQHFNNAWGNGETYDGIVFDYPWAVGGADGGDGILNSAGGTFTVQNCLVLPGYTDGFASCDLVNAGGAGDVKVFHNTVAWLATDALARQPAVYVKDYTTTGLVYTESRSNIVAGPAAGPAAREAFDTQLVDPSADHIDPAGFTHNNIYPVAPYVDPVSGNTYYGYEVHLSSGIPGASDVSVDPQFVDPTRGVATWAVHKGAATSGQTLREKLDAARALLAADPLLTRTDLIPWVRAGFAPTNPALHGTAHDGGDIGAVAFRASAQPSRLSLLGCGA